MFFSSCNTALFVDSKNLPITSERMEVTADTLEEFCLEDTVIVNPEAPMKDQLMDSLPADLEENMAKEPYDLNVEKDDLLYRCTVCKERLYYQSADNYKEHPKLKVILCKGCHKFLTDGDFTRDEDGSDNQCSWCGEGGHLLVCDFCPAAFCKKCIRNNFKRDMLMKIESSQSWKCFVCNPKPLVTHVLRNSSFQDMVKKHLKKKDTDAKKQTARKSAPARTETNSSDIRRADFSMSSDPRTDSSRLTSVHEMLRKAENPKSTQKDMSQASPNTLLPQFKTPANSPLASILPKSSISAPAQSATSSQHDMVEVTLRQLTNKYFEGRDAECDAKFLESVILEHNRFGKQLMSLREALHVHYKSFRTMRQAGFEDQTYKATRLLLGKRLSFEVSQSITTLIGLFSPTSSAGPPQQHPQEHVRSSITKPPNNILNGQSEHHLLNPSPVNNARTYSSATHRATSNHLSTKNKEFIDINELSSIKPPPSRLVPNEVIDLCSDEGETMELSDTSAPLDTSNESERQGFVSELLTDSSHPETSPVKKSKNKGGCSDEENKDPILNPNSNIPDSSALNQLEPVNSQHETLESSCSSEDVRSLTMDSSSLPCLPDPAEPGPSGISKRTLRRLLKEQGEKISVPQRSNQSLSGNSSDEEVQTKKRSHRFSTQSKPEKGIVFRAPACQKRKLSSSGSSSSDSSEGEGSQSKTSTVTKSPKADDLQLDPASSDSRMTELSRDVELPDAEAREQANVYDENDAAMKGLAEALLSESDGDESDLPIRRSLRTQAKLNPKLKPKPQKRISPKQRQQQRRMEEMTSSLKSLTSTQRRYMMQRARGLVVSLQERKETPLQRLLQTIATKSIQEVDSENKLGKCASVKLTKIDPTDTEKIKKLMQETDQCKPKPKNIPKDSDDSGDSDIDREIKKLSKFTVILNRDKVADGGRHSGRKLSNKKSKPDVKSPVNNDEDSLSELSSQESDKDENNESESDVENNKVDDDILLLPDTEQIENEEAMLALLHNMSDSEGPDMDHGELSESDSEDSAAEKDKLKTKQKSSTLHKKQHPLERAILDGDDESSTSDADLQSLDSDSELDRMNTRSKKNVIRSDSGESYDIDVKLAARNPAKAKKKKKVKKVEDCSKESDSSKETVDSNSDSDIIITTPSSKGRHKIRKLIDDSKLTRTTKNAAKEELDRRKRIEERQKKYNAISAADSPQKIERRRQLVLERDSKGEPVIEVDHNLVKRLKPHQFDAVEFLWDCVCETVARSNKDKGGGCILAHCMGLGKTLSVVTFLHTLLAYEDKLSLRRMLVICPLNTVINWKQEVDKWTSQLEIDIDVDDLHTSKSITDRLCRLRRWFNTGGIMIIGYEMFRNLTVSKHIKKKEQIDKLREYLLNPGPDVVVCDEGHLIKNAKSGLRKCVTLIRTTRRIVLTGTPLQNNLKEYYCMVDFVKPNLLGTAREFTNRFVAPITNGQYEDSTPQDVKLMKKRAHVLHEMLAGFVQRKDYSALTKFLPPKHEYILTVKLSELQIKLYQKYIDAVSQEGVMGSKCRLFQDYQTLSRVWSHPKILELHKERNDDGFIDDGTSEDTPSDTSEDDDDILMQDSDDSTKEWKPPKRITQKKEDKPSETPEHTNGDTNDVLTNSLWWKSCLDSDTDLDEVSLGIKFAILFEILKKCIEIGDKVLIFSQSLLSLDLMEDFFAVAEEAYVKNDTSCPLFCLGEMKRGKNYFRIDGGVDGKNRSKATEYFNKTQNYNAKIFLISTKAGGLGINLVGANRVIIFDASWNPSFDVQAIFRAYRFGQHKPVYVYRLLAQGTMEEKIYERQISKLSLSERVVDERQIERHFTSRDLAELYSFKPHTGEINTPLLPKDLLLADLLNSHGNFIIKVMEHDSLLANLVHEELSEEERKMAWKEYQEERERAERPLPTLAPPIPAPASGAAAAAENTLNSFIPLLNVKNPPLYTTLFVTDTERTSIAVALKDRFPGLNPLEFHKLLEANVNNINQKRFQTHMQNIQRKSVTMLNPAQQQQPGDNRVLQPNIRPKVPQQQQQQQQQPQMVQQQVTQQPQKQVFTKLGTNMFAAVPNNSLVKQNFTASQLPSSHISNSTTLPVQNVVKRF